VIEGTVLHHENHEVLEVVEAWWRHVDVLVVESEEVARNAPLK
jgi:hypothetical protein